MSLLLAACWSAAVQAQSDAGVSIGNLLVHPNGQAPGTAFTAHASRAAQSDSATILIVGDEATYALALSSQPSRRRYDLGDVEHAGCRLGFPR